MTDWRARARAMVRRQILGRDIPAGIVTEAMADLPRHRFVPVELEAHAWEDGPLPIGRGQTISQPYMVARMTWLLGVGPGDAVLEIGTGSGYQAALLARMGCSVVSVERIAALARQARSVLTDLGLAVTVVVGDGREGYAPSAPYRGIIVTAGAEELAPAWSDQLDRGGRLVVPLRVGPGTERLLVRARTEGGFVDAWEDYCRFVPVLPGVDES
ncbi:MAG: protein-L-isoaspartate(D-aspartate) O-methyltransferase [Synergistaceae bacterium]|nr:protein-L-isoaspartate(D-aspartate) O-methyltransferase [Synergistaceae bacterium]